MLFAHYKVKTNPSWYCKSNLPTAGHYPHADSLSQWHGSSQRVIYVCSVKKPHKLLSVSLRIHHIYALHFERFFRLTFSSITVFQQYLWEILNVKVSRQLLLFKTSSRMNNKNNIFSYYNSEVLVVTYRRVWSHLFWYSKEPSPTDVFSPAKK